LAQFCAQAQQRLLCLLGSSTRLPRLVSSRVCSVINSAMAKLTITKLLALYAPMQVGSNNASLTGILGDMEVDLGKARPEACDQIVAGAVERNCATRTFTFNSCTTKRCKCPFHQKINGEKDACAPSKYDDGRKFDPSELKSEGCACVSKSLIPGPTKWLTSKETMENPHESCAQETYFQNLDFPDSRHIPDFLGTAASWCNADLVPIEKRIPEALQGLYWMKGLAVEDVAFCTSLAEWDGETRSAFLSPWTDFIWRVGADKKLPLAGPRLVYNMTFTDETYKEAKITTDLGAVINSLINFPLNDVENTDDGDIEKENDDDVFERPSSVLGVSLGKYYAVRIMDQGGKPRVGDSKQADWYKRMQDAEHRPHTSFMRYVKDCDVTTPEEGVYKAEYYCRKDKDEKKYEKQDKPCSDEPEVSPEVHTLVV